MDFEDAWPYVEKARSIAKERGLVISVAVHDAAGHPAHVPAIKQAEAVLTLDAISSGPLRDVSLNLMPGEIVTTTGELPPATSRIRYSPEK